MHLGVIVILALVISGAIMGLRRRNEINALRQPKNGWHQGHKLRYRTTEIPKSTRRRRVEMYVPLDENDMEELDGMFGSAGDRPEDY